MLCDVSSKECVCGVCVYALEVRGKDRCGAEEEEGGCRVFSELCGDRRVASVLGEITSALC